MFPDPEAFRSENVCLAPQGCAGQYFQVARRGLTLLKKVSNAAVRDAISRRPAE